jgi:hypothetical protein
MAETRLCTVTPARVVVIMFCLIGVQNPEWVHCSHDENMSASRHQDILRMRCSQVESAVPLHVSGGNTRPAAMTARGPAGSAAAKSAEQKPGRERRGECAHRVTLDQSAPARHWVPRHTGRSRGGCVHALRSSRPEAAQCICFPSKRSSILCADSQDWRQEGGTRLCDCWRRYFPAGCMCGRVLWNCERPRDKRHRPNCGHISWRAMCNAAQATTRARR